MATESIVETRIVYIIVFLRGFYGRGVQILLKQSSGRFDTRNLHHIILRVKTANTCQAVQVTQRLSRCNMIMNSEC